MRATPKARVADPPNPVKMPENKKAASANDETAGVAKFVRDRVDPLSRAFAETPLMQIRLRTPQGNITLVKSARHAGLGSSDGASDSSKTSDGVKPQGRPTHLSPLHDGEAGRTYTTVNAEVVGIFRDLPQPPSTGDAITSGQVLGFIEALRLRNEVRSPIDGTLIAQVVVDGQAVDFGEALFVVGLTVPATDQSAAAQGAGSSGPDGAASPPQPTEPPRL